MYITVHLLLVQAAKGDPGYDGPRGEKGDKGQEGDRGPRGFKGDIGRRVMHSCMHIFFEQTQ